MTMSNKQLGRLSAIMILLAAGLALSGCNVNNDTNPGSVHTSQQTVDLGSATSVKANISASTDADLTIHDGADALLNAQITYNELLKPDVSYAVEGNLGTLQITQPSLRNLVPRKLNNVWDLQFGTDTPLDLTTNVASGNSKINLSTLRLASFNADTSSGNTDTTIAGTQTLLKSVVMKSSSGSIGLNLDGSFPLLDSVGLTESSGNVHVTLNGDFATLASLQLKNSSGNTVIDVSGNLTHDLTSTVKTSSGNVTVNLPSNVGVRVTAKVSSGNVTASGLHLENGAYVNDAYGSSAVTLSFDIQVSSGNVNLSVGS